MCFGGQKQPTAAQQTQATTPAPAPAPPAPDPQEAQVGAKRKNEERRLFGVRGPSMRIDRSATSGGVGKGGSGLKM